MVNTVWNSVNVNRRITLVTQLMDVNVDKASVDLIALRHYNECWRPNEVSQIKFQPKSTII